MEKLKSRLDAFSDAIIAIIITIMVLDIPPVLHDSLSNYLQLGKSVGIFFISFIFIANMWYQHGTAFSEIDTMTYRIVILDMLFLAPLSLMPLMTNMMAQNTTRATVILYGLLQLVVNLLFRYLAKAIIHLQYTDKQEMQQVYQKIYGSSNRYLDWLSIGALIIAAILPELALFFYLAYPVLMFLLNSEARQQMYDVAELPEDQQKDFTTLTASGLREFRKAQREIWQDYGQDNTDETRTGAGSDATQTGKVAPEPQQQDNDATAPQTGNDKNIGNLPDNWSRWLDQNVDPRRQRQIRTHYSRATQEQQERMQQWFNKRNGHVVHPAGKLPRKALTPGNKHKHDA